MNYFASVFLYNIYSQFAQFFTKSIDIVTIYFQFLIIDMTFDLMYNILYKVYFTFAIIFKEKV